jgi:PIN domain nuclease of toxin-antitoxin system
LRARDARWRGETQTSSLAISVEHGASVADLPPHHRDPFDRLLIAQATLERLPSLTSDPQIGKYDVEVIDA